jgi:hypothetical protein
LAVYIKSELDAFLKRNKPSSAERNSKSRALVSRSDVSMYKDKRISKPSVIG